MYFVAAFHLAVINRKTSETHFVVIYFGMRCVVPETPKSSSASHARPARIIKRRNVGKNLALATGSFIFQAIQSCHQNLLKGQCLESDGNPKVVFTCDRQKK